ncbi:APC family permease [Streptosporangium sp. NPDC001681]|uniref:APC family permease n=1 Tax=Streptosporangium sp. NPDC001681 TaxID=3154395 RepID=UPI0033202075
MTAYSDPQTAEPAGPGGKTALLHRGLGVGSIVFMVIAAVAPLGAACAVLPLVFALSGNAAAPLYFLSAVVVLCVFAVGFTLMSRRVQNAGAFYSYVQAGLGKISGAGTASLALVSYYLLLIGLYALLGVSAAAVVDQYLGLTVDWWVPAFAFLIVVALLGYRDIEVSAKVLGVALVLEALVVLVIDIAILAQGGVSGFSAQPLDPSHAFDGTPGLGLMFAFFAFIGFEATAVFRSEATNPTRTIPRATYIAVALIGTMYAFTSYSIAIGIGADGAAAVSGADPSNVVQNLATQYVGTAMEDAVRILLVTSVFACVLSFHNVVARYQFNLANGKLLPGFLGEVHPKHRAPSHSSVVVTVMSVVVLVLMLLLGLDPITEVYTWFSGAATLGVIALMALTSISVIAFHRRYHADTPLWGSLLAPVLSLIGLGFVLYMIVRNFDLLVGTNAAATAILVALAASFVIGAVVTAVTRARRPDRYAELLENCRTAEGRPSQD